MAHFASVMSGGYLVSNTISLLLVKETGRLVDTTGDFRVALSGTSPQKRRSINS